jgi:hypothetical protein
MEMETEAEAETETETEKETATEGKSGILERQVLKRLPAGIRAGTGNTRTSLREWNNPSTNGKDELAWKFANLIIS